MRYGIWTQNFGEYADPRRLAALAVEAEAAGWDGHFLWDHILYRGVGLDVCDPWVAMAAMAAATERIMLGPMVAALPRRRPWKVAREVVTLDRLSNGRVILGVGIGSPADREFAPFGEATDDTIRAQKLDESLDILAGLWSGEPFSYSGDHYTLDEMVFRTTPLQQARVPIWVGGVWPHKPPFRRAARWDGVFPIRANRLWMSPDQVRDMLAYVRSHRTTDAPFDVAVTGWSERTGAGIAQVRQLEDAGATWWFEWLDPNRGDFNTTLARVRAGPPHQD